MRWLVPGLLLTILSGCDREPTWLLPDQQSTVDWHQADSSGSRFVRGSVRWDGPMPEKVVFTVLGPTTTPILPGHANPLHPRIDPATQGIRDAVVFSKIGCFAADFPKVTVRIDDENIRIEQGPRKDAPVALIAVGSEIEFISLNPKQMPLIRAEGAEFFTIPLPNAEKTVRRLFDTPGIVELSNAGGDCWQRAYLFVCPHGSFTQTDVNGNFELKNLPEDTSELTCWLPDSRIQRLERNPETGQFFRLKYAPPIQIRQTAHSGRVEFRLKP